jgi:WD40 repeat protein
MLGVRKTVAATRLADAAWNIVLPDYIRVIACNPARAVAAILTPDAEVTLLDTADGATLRSLSGHQGGASALAWSPGGELLATGGKDGLVRIWGLDGSLLHTLEAAPKTRQSVWVSQLEWSSSGGEAILMASAEKWLRVWTRAGDLISESTPLGTTIQDASWRPGAPEIAVVGYGGSRLVDSKTGRGASEWDQKVAMLAARWEQRGRYLACGCQENMALIWQPDTNGNFHISGFEGKVRSFAWSSNSRYLAFGGSASVMVWDFSGRGPSVNKPVILEAHCLPVAALAWAPNRGVLATAGADGLLCFWDPLKKAKVGEGVAPCPASALAWDFTGKTILAGYEDGRLTAWRPR